VGCEEDKMAQRKGTAKLNEFLEIERQVQERWKNERVFEVDAPEPGTPEAQ
jgi:leucyl-tRNA synthetase